MYVFRDFLRITTVNSYDPIVDHLRSPFKNNIQTVYRQYLHESVMQLTRLELLYLYLLGPEKSFCKI